MAKYWVVVYYEKDMDLWCTTDGPMGGVLYEGYDEGFCNAPIYLKEPSGPWRDWLEESSMHYDWYIVEVEHDFTP